MNKKNKVLVSVLVASVVALLIALCFVGNTFARYTLKQEESVSASIAEWGVALTPNTVEGDDDDDVTVKDGTVTVPSLKPSGDGFEKYVDTTATPNVTYEYSESQRTNENFVLVATLSNTGEVDAMVEITMDEEITATYGDYNGAYESIYHVTEGSNKDGNGKYQAADDYGYAETTATGADYEKELAEHLKVEAYYSTTADNLTAETKSSATPFDGSYSNTLKADSSGVMYIYFDVEWISDLVDTTNSTQTTTVYANGDGFDTWCGIWVESFVFNVSISAVQAS